MHRVALLLLIGAVALTVATEVPSRTCCSAGDRTIVQKQWRELFGNQNAKLRSTATLLVLQRVLKDYPDAAALFKNVGIDDVKGGPFTAHLHRIWNALDMSVNLLSDPDALGEALDHLADQHAVRTGVKKAHFQSFGEALGRGLPRLIDDYDAISWKACFRGILSKISSKLAD